ncbi:isopenicillin N synthase-like dioxygenase [Rubricella aquisinus]|uniref:2-oxoglutarate-dependent ethylene/succinate-forming enzyme n=1 Tax=Rubricella aquisinus TaxID=2028108 RepID=A0A840WL26_9RHOB|nr:isopenicillin N synthase family oxygenase [Rubricella aquisinus]MBB5514362.1 isopenicillin N synthase-like dioxygenase [Rubricella aquisinus]
MTEFSDIPVIDISARHGPERASLAQRFVEVYGSVGFGYITGHGIPNALIDGVFEASRAFHALPREAKMAVELDANHRGFIPIDTSTDVNSTLAEVTKPNQSESFMMMREDAAGTPGYLSGPNQWPDLPGFRDALEAYNAALSALGAEMMVLVLEGLGVPPGPVMDGFAPPTTWLRLLHYPPRPADAAEDLYGSAPHTDFGCLTILAQDGVGGLQVQTPAGAWVDAPRIEGSFVVNVGDMLHRMSNGRLKSTPHRVINRSGQERYSCPFFYDPHVSYTVAPLPGQGGPGFEPLVFGDFLRAELTAGYQAHQDEKG